MPDLFLLVAQSVDADDVAAMFDDGDAFVADLMASDTLETWAADVEAVTRGSHEWREWEERYYGRS